MAAAALLASCSGRAEISPLRKLRTASGVLFACASCVCVLFLGACSSEKAGRVPPKLDFEVVSPQEQAIQVIDLTPQSFVVPFSVEALSWERARLFFAKYTKDPLITELDKSGENLELRAPTAELGYSFSVTRMLEQGGYRYKVYCLPNLSKPEATSLLATRNAKNLARFIKDGELEVSLLTR